MARVPDSEIPAQVRLGNVIAAFGGWIFLFVLAASPLAWGGLRTKGLLLIEGGLVASIAIWILSMIVTWRRPRVPWWIMAASTLALGAGWWLTLRLAPAATPSGGVFLPVHGWMPGGDTTTNRGFSVVIQATLAVGALFVATDLAARPIWRLRIWRAITAGGLAVVALGLAQKVTGAIGVYWQHEWKVWSFFGPFHYHGNAGAYLNLVWPLMFAFLVASLLRPKAKAALAWWLPVFLVSMAAVFVNMSKAAMAIAVGLGLVLTVWFARLAWPHLNRARRWGAVIGAVVVLAAVAGIVHQVGWDFARNHWAQFLQNRDSADWRLQAYRTYARMYADTGMAGIGPGQWSVKFPEIAPDLWKVQIDLHAPYAHEDYWQTLIEWGLAGAVGWAVIYFGPLIAGLGTLWKFPSDEVSRRRLLHGSSMVAVAGVLLHAAVDFPLQVPAIQITVCALLGTILGPGREK